MRFIQNKIIYYAVKASLFAFTESRSMRADFSWDHACLCRLPFHFQKKSDYWAHDEYCVQQVMILPMATLTIHKPMLLERAFMNMC